jgi:hypothetical protein
MYVVTEKIYSKKLKEVLYIKMKNWGLLGDAQVILITKSLENNFEPNPKTEYIYRGLISFIYQFKDDTLTIYCKNRSEIPSELNTGIVIRQIEMGDVELDDIKEKYLNGLRSLDETFGESY